MKNFLLPAFLSIFGLSAFAQIDNGDFESWNKLILFEHPVTGMNTMSSNYETFFDNGQLNVTEIDAQDGLGMRIENKMGSDEVMPGYFLFGKTPNSEGEELIFDGGFEVTDQNVNGLRMDLNYNFPNGSSGFVIVQFKSQGSPAGNGNMGPGTFMFPLGGTQEWTTTEFSFEGSLGVPVDQCVIGVASADLIGEDSPFEEGAFVEVDNVELMGSEDMVPGGTFEQWSFVEPIFYPANVEVEVHPFEANYQRTEIAFEGNYALALLSTEQEGEIEIGEAIMGMVEDNEIIPTIELSDDHAMLNFMYQYSTDNDKGEARVIFYQEDSDGFVPVFQRAFDLNVTNGFEMLEYEFATELAENNIQATHMAVAFSSSKMENNTPQDGSVLIVDNVQLGTALGIFASYRRVSDVSIHAYPNPTVGRVVFDFLSTKSGYYRVRNALGIQIDIVEYSNKKEVIYDLAGQPNGKYFFTFHHSGGQTQSVRVMKN